LIFSAVTRRTPLVPRIGPGSGYEVVSDLVAAHHDCLLERMDRERAPPTRHLAVSVANGDRRGLRVRVGANPVLTGTKHSESQAGRIELDVLGLREISNADREGAL
jgi:hypothetical protein